MTNVVNIGQGAGYSYKKGMAKYEQKKYLEALSLLKRACQAEDCEIDYTVALAQCYTDMGCFDQSNKVLAPILYLFEDEKSFDKYEFPEYLFYIMGCNFFGMQCPGAAAECFTYFCDQYEDSPDVKEIIASAVASGDIKGVNFSEFNKKPNTKELSVLNLVASDNFDAAFTAIMDESTTGSWMYSANFMLYLIINFAEANLVEQTIALCNAFEKNAPNEPMAICAKVDYYRVFDRELENLQEYIEKICKINTEDYNDSYAIARLLHESQRYEIACEFAKKALTNLKYDFRLLALLVSCYCKMGDFVQAQEHINTLVKIRLNTIEAQYWADKIELAVKGEIDSLDVPCSLRLPNDEMEKIRLEVLTEIDQSDSVLAMKIELVAVRATDEYKHELLRHLSKATRTNAVLIAFRNLAFNTGFDEYFEIYMQAVLSILGVNSQLHCCNKDEMRMLENLSTELMCDNTDKAVKIYVEILKSMIEGMYKLDCLEYYSYAVLSLKKYFRLNVNLRSYTQFSGEEIEWAGPLVYNALNLCEIPVTKKEIIQQFKISAYKLNKILSDIDEVWEIEKCLIENMMDTKAVLDADKIDEDNDE